MATFPRQQLFVLALCRICEPIAFMSIFPYIYRMVESFDVAGDQGRIGIYAGAVTSAFAFAEFSTGVLWGRLSDRVGRKPVLIGGLAGTALSMLIFGFATSLPVALLGRALGGLLNGNIGVLQTTVAEMITSKEHQPRAYSIMPFVWCLGSILGPALGGALAQPCIGYPSVFRPGTVFDRYPFLLPNLVCTAILLGGVLVGLLFLDETHEEIKYRRDVGRDAGRWLLRLVRGRDGGGHVCGKAGDANLQEAVNLLADDELPPGYRTTDGSPNPSRAASPAKAERPARGRPAPRPFTRPVVLHIVGYGLLAYHTMSFDQLMPIFLSEPASDAPPRLPFRFVGGFDLAVRQIGVMLSVQGVYSMAAQLLLFPFVVRRLGNLGTFRLVALSWPVLYVVVPYTVLLPAPLRMAGVCLCLLWRITAQVLAYPANAILLTNSAPSLLTLGVINGVAASTASLSRAVGPTVAGAVHAWGLGLGSTGAAWWVSGIVCLAGAVESLWMEEGQGRMDDDAADEEAARPPDGRLDPLAMDAALATAAHRAEHAGA